MANTWTWLVAIIGSVLVYVSGLQIQDGTCAYRKWEEPGDVKLLVIGGLYENEAGKCTNRLSKDGIPLILTFDWLIQTLNGNNSNNQPFIPGLKIGYDIYENCNNKELTTDLLYFDHQMSNCSGQPKKPNNYAAVISLTSPETTRTLSRLVHPLPVVRPSPSTPLLLDIPNLVQTVASFTFEVQAMFDLMVKMKWNYIAVVNEDTEDGREMAAEFKRQARNRSICVKFQYTLQMISATVKQSAANITKDLFNHITNAYNMSIVIVYLGGIHGANCTVEASKTQPRRPGSKLTWMFPSFIDNNDTLKAKFLFDIEDGDLMISLNYPSETLDEINTHYEYIIDGSKGSPITDLMRTFKDEHGSLGTTIDHASNMINAVLAITAALKGVWEDACNVTGLDISLCTSLPNELQANMLNHIKTSLNVSSIFQPHYLPQAYQASDLVLGFNDDGTMEDTTLHVILYTPKTDTELELFTYNGNGVPDISVNLPTSVCSSNTVCLECREAIDLRYSYIPGDYLILGIFSLRVYNEETNRCQSLRRGTNDIITVSAFMQAILEKRKSTGLSFGGIAIDDCYSSYNTSHYLSGLFSKTAMIRDPATGLPIDFDRVIAIIGALSSSVSLVVSDTATSLRLPMISYAASSPELDNRDRYPYFLRTVPSDILQVKGIINLIKYLNITRVGVIYIDDSYGKSGLKNLQVEAANNNICIDSPLRIFLGMSDDELKVIVTKLTEQQLGVVVYFSIDSIAQRLLEKINENNGNPIVFIASEAWGTNRALITDDLGKASMGSLVFNIAALQSTNASFKAFLRSLNSSQNQHNRWIPNFFERENNCDFIDSFEKGYTELCDNESKTTLDDATIENLYKDQRGIHVMNAVHTVTEGYKALCSSESPASCSRKKPEIFVKEIHATKMDNERVYTTQGNGNIGMTINNIQRDPDNPNEFNYEQVGSFSKDGVLTITKSPIFYNDVKKAVTNILDVGTDMKTNTDCNMFLKTSCLNVCLLRTTQTPETTTSVTVTEATQKDDSLMRGLTIGFGVLAGIMAVALILLIALLFRRQDADRHSSDGKYSTEATSVNPDNTSIYDEPGTINYERSRSENNFRVRGSFLSLQDTTPTQYAHIKPSPVQIHHKRHMSNQELVSHHSHIQDRPSSSLSAPLTQMQVSPVARHIIAANKRSPKMSHSPYGTGASNSPHGTLRSQELYRKRGDFSPKSRHTSDMRVLSVNSLPVLRREALDSDDYERNSVFVDESLNGHFSHHPEGYLYPQTGSVNNISSDKPTLTYLTAKDFVREESLDEEEKQTDNESKAISNDSEPVNTQQSNQMQQFGYDPSLISPSNNEIMAINFPDTDTVRYSKSQTPKQFQTEQREANFIDSPVDKNKEPMVPRAGSSGTFSPSTRSNQPDIIPETGPFENDERVIII